MDGSVGRVERVDSGGDVIVVEQTVGVVVLALKVVAAHPWQLGRLETAALGRSLRLRTGRRTASTQRRGRGRGGSQG